jgi:hypothetical protein
MAVSRWTFTSGSSPIAGSNGNPWGSAALNNSNVTTGSGVVINEASDTITLAGPSFPDITSSYIAEFKFSTSNSPSCRVFSAQPASGFGQISIEIASRAATVYHWNVSDVRTDAYSPANFITNDGAMHVYKIEWTGTVVKFFRDGSQVGTDQTQTGVPPAAAAVYLIGNPAGLAGDASNPYTLEYFEVTDSAGAGPPAAPTGVTAGSVTALSATASWTDNSADETGFKVEYAPSPYSSWTTLAGSPTAANATSLATGNVLTDGTSYKFRVASTNANGDSAWVESNEFTTVGVGSGRMLLLGVG